LVIWFVDLYISSPNETTETRLKKNFDFPSSAAKMMFFWQSHFLKGKKVGKTACFSHFTDYFATL